MGAWFRLDPCRLRRKSHILVSYFEQCLHLRLPNKKDHIMCSNALLANYARNVFDILNYGFV